MNREESIALFNQGRDAWNAWAQKVLAERKTLEEQGRWYKDGSEGALTGEARAWQNEAASNFSEHTFECPADFYGFLLPGSATFDNATFKGDAGFGEATFKGEAAFRKAAFQGDVEFYRATFESGARFDEATLVGAAAFGEAKFRGDARFDVVSFEEDAEFDLAIFEDGTRFNNATFRGDTKFHRAKFRGIAEFEKATFNNAVEFSEATFEGYTGFRLAVFKGDVWFGEVTFESVVVFEEATFEGIAAFGGVTFEHAALYYVATFANAAVFSEATFESDAGFTEATFEGVVGFAAATFEDTAKFQLCRFLGATDFGRSRFMRTADFRAIEAESAFSLADTVFQAVPGFIQAHFSEAPRCDNLIIAPRRVWPRTWAEMKDRFRGDPDLPARWRALKRLAIQGHDHEREQIFFKGELLARRWHTDKLWHAAFLFGVLYQWLSDFGRSLLRPLFWWGFSLLIFAGVYLSQHESLDSKVTAATISSMAAILPSVDPSQELLCQSAGDDAVTAAFDLSIRNALLFVGQTSREKLRQNYVCLYGSEGAIKGTSSASGPTSIATPSIPSFVVLMGHLQNVISAVLIFLFLLGIRNHFKIK